MDRPALASVFSPVSSASTFEETVGRLGRAIRLGVLEPGQKLPPERDLAEQLGISRSTLRQALRTLTETGHLTAQRGRSGGTFVAAEPPIAGTIAPEALQEWRALLDQRTGVELGAVQLTCERAGDETLATLAEETARMRAAIDDWRSFRRADVAFHICLAEGSGSAWIIQAMTEVHGTYSDMLDLVPHPATVLLHAVEQHERITEALVAREPEQAVARMREHIRGADPIFEGLAAWPGS